MNTKRRGDAFEDAIYELLKQQIETDRFWARRECCHVFRKKAYHSKDRQKDIIFDLSIEIALPGEKSYSLLVLVECKDYSTSVPVSDLEEFWAKVQQVAGANVKGIVASTAAFQDGALRFAQSKGFAVLRYFGDSEFKWVLKRSASWSGLDSRAEASGIRQALTDSSFLASYYDCAFLARETYTFSSNRMFEALCVPEGGDSGSDLIAFIANPKGHGRPAVPYVEKDDIESLAAECLSHVGYQDGPVNLNLICNRQREERGLSVRHEQVSHSDPRILGSLSFDPLEILLFGGHRESGRSRFTLAHELGHLFMAHDRFMFRERTDEDDLQEHSYSRLDFIDVRRMEWQANYFASTMLLPSAQFCAHLFAIASRRELRDRGFGLLFVDHQPVNQDNFYAVTDYLAETFRVSRQATVIRLTGLGYLNDVRGMQGFKSTRGLGAV